MKKYNYITIEIYKAKKVGQKGKYISLISSRKYVTADNNYLFTIMIYE